MTSPQEITTEELRNAFLAHLAAMVRYWNKQPEGSRRQLEGLVHSILVAIDGCAQGLPPFNLAPDLPDDDPAAPSAAITDGVQLHEEWAEHCRKGGQ